MLVSPPYRDDNEETVEHFSTKVVEAKNRIDFYPEQYSEAYRNLVLEHVDAIDEEINYRMCKGWWKND